PAAVVLHALAQIRVRGGQVRHPGDRLRCGHEVSPSAAEQRQSFQSRSASAVQFLPLFTPDAVGAPCCAGSVRESPGMRTPVVPPWTRRPSTSNSAEYRGRSTGAENVLWNLDDLVSPPVSEAVDAALDAADQGMDRLAAKYRGRVAG